MSLGYSYPPSDVQDFSIRGATPSTANTGVLPGVHSGGHQSLEELKWALGLSDAQISASMFGGLEPAEYALLSYHHHGRWRSGFRDANNERKARSFAYKTKIARQAMEEGLPPLAHEPPDARRAMEAAVGRPVLKRQISPRSVSALLQSLHLPHNDPQANKLRAMQTAVATAATAMPERADERPDASQPPDRPGAYLTDERYSFAGATPLRYGPSVGERRAYVPATRVSLPASQTAYTREPAGAVRPRRASGRRQSNMMLHPGTPLPKRPGGGSNEVIRASTALVAYEPLLEGERAPGQAPRLLLPERVHSSTSVLAHSRGLPPYSSGSAGGGPAGNRARAQSPPPQTAPGRDRVHPPRTRSHATTLTETAHGARPISPHDRARTTLGSPQDWTGLSILRMSPRRSRSASPRDSSRGRARSAHSTRRSGVLLDIEDDRTMLDTAAYLHSLADQSPMGSPRKSQAGASDIAVPLEDATGESLNPPLRGFGNGQRLKQELNFTISSIATDFGLLDPTQADVGFSNNIRKMAQAQAGGRETQGGGLSAEGSKSDMQQPHKKQ